MESKRRRDGNRWENQEYSPEIESIKQTMLVIFPLPIVDKRASPPF